jgi:hypothetical protein
VEWVLVAQTECSMTDNESLAFRTPLTLVQSRSPRNRDVALSFVLYACDVAAGAIPAHLDFGPSHLLARCDGVTLGELLTRYHSHSMLEMPLVPVEVRVCWPPISPHSFDTCLIPTSVFHLSV